MNNTIAIARRELAEKKFVLMAAIALAVLSVGVAFAPGVRVADRDTAVMMASAILTIAFTLGLACVLGTSMIGRDLSEGRLSFYFAKPIAASSIWFGKLAAAWILILTSFAIIGAPGFLAGGFRGLTGWTGEPEDLAYACLAFAAAMFFVCHTVGTMARSRSALIAIDFAFAVVIGGALWFIGRMLVDGFATVLFGRWAYSIAAAILVTAIATGAWQLSRGRIDRRQNHRELSRFLWTSLAAITIVAGAFVAWVVSATPVDIVADGFGIQSRNSSWAAIGGKMRNRVDYHAAFIYNADDGSYTRLRGRGTPTFSRDGKAAAWVRMTRGNAELDLLDLDTRKVLHTGVPAPHGRVELSHDGSRAAVVRGTLFVYELKTDRLLGAVRYGGVYDRVERYFFATPDLVRLFVRLHPSGVPWSKVTEPFRIVEFDLKTKRLTETGRFVELASFQFTANADGSRVIVHRPGNPIHVRDGRTGAIVVTLPGGEEMRSPMFLRDGRIAVAQVANGKTTIGIYSPDGVFEKSIDVGAFATAQLGAEAAANRVFVRVSRERPAEYWSSALVNLDDGKVQVHDALPMIDSWANDPRATLRPPENFFVNKGEGVSIWNTKTGAIRPLG